MNALMLIIAAFASAFALSCKGAEKVEMLAMAKAPETEIARGLEALSIQRVFFGHQSVGRNLVEGLGELASEAGQGGPRIAEIRSAWDISGPGLYHSEIGRNLEPMSKLHDFESLLRGGIGRTIDVAFLKFCYVDIDGGTDVAALFSAYRSTMAGLSADFPSVVFMHCTVPLVVDDGGAEAAIKRLIGRKVNGHEDNERREAFNRLIRAEYGGKAPLFDLALVEASAEDGSALVHSVAGREYYAMRGEYSDDGGHLNAAGRRRAAAWLLVELGRALH
jgi:hypothetical protein